VLGEKKRRPGMGRRGVVFLIGGESRRGGKTNAFGGSFPGQVARGVLVRHSRSRLRQGRGRVGGNPAHSTWGWKGGGKPWLLEEWGHLVRRGNRQRSSGGGGRFRDRRGEALVAKKGRESVEGGKKTAYPVGQEVALFLKGMSAKREGPD